MVDLECAFNGGKEETRSEARVKVRVSQRALLAELLLTTYHPAGP